MLKNCYVKKALAPTFYAPPLLVWPKIAANFAEESLTIKVFALEGATVIIDGSTMGVVTDAEGYFIFNDVPPRTYNISANFLGYASQTEFNVIVKSVGTADLLFKLEENSEVLDEVVVAKALSAPIQKHPLYPIFICC